MIALELGKGSLVLRCEFRLLTVKFEAEKFLEFLFFFSHGDFVLFQIVFTVGLAIDSSLITRLNLRLQLLNHFIQITHPIFKPIRPRFSLRQLTFHFRQVFILSSQFLTQNPSLTLLALQCLL